MMQLLPQPPAAFEQPDIPISERTEPLLAGILPEPMPAILDILLDNAFLPAGSYIAEIWIKQVMCGHGKEARVHHAP